MKLIQYRFTSGALIHASQVGRSVQAAFENSGDLSLRVVYVDNSYSNKLCVKGIDIGDVEKTVANLLIQSYSDTVDYINYVTIKSNTSCRFVVMEDDGLLRVCHAQGDAPIYFENMSYITEDASDLLIKSDLFD